MNHLDTIIQLQSKVIALQEQLLQQKSYNQTDKEKPLTPHQLRLMSRPKLENVIANCRQYNKERVKSEWLQAERLNLPVKPHRGSKAALPRPQFDNYHIYVYRGILHNPEVLANIEAKLQSIK
jgi:hypothetical protein